MRSLVFLVGVLVACGDATEQGPFTDLPLDGDFQLGTEQPVHVARDRYGVAHIVAHNVRDAGFVQGYVMAHDRLPQMDILRRFGAGTLAELFGALDPSVIDTDLEMRVHRMKPLAEATLEMLRASTDPTDVQIVQLLERFADGVNAYAQQLRDHEWDLDPEVAASFPADKFVDWSPADSLVLGRFQAFALSWSTPFELDATELYQKLDTFYDKATTGDGAARIARKGISKDLMIFQPVGLIPTIDGFPNVVSDSGSRSDAKPGELAGRPVVPQELFDRARTFFPRTIFTGPFGSLGPHAFMRPYAGSNNWAVSPTLTGDGTALLATDQHLQLPNPSIFYPTHLQIDGDDPIDVMGITFPGIPGVILGSNGNVAWSATVSEHDVNDVYLETIAPCGAGDCVTFNGNQVPIEPFEETIRVGAFGTITEEKKVTYELVPHHGPIIPEVANHTLVPRTGTSALTVKYTGYVPTFEIRALWKLARATKVSDGFAALADFSYGSQNWTMIDNAGPSIAWTTNAVVPERTPATYAWNATTNPSGAAPFFVLDGKGAFEWTGRMDSRYVPHAINPPQGYLATANADPVGATFDNDPLNQPEVNGHSLYVGVTYAAGVREERIANLIEAGGHSLDAMAQIQHDTHSTVGGKLTPAVLTTLALLDNSTGAPTDAKNFIAGLSAADRALLVQARTLLTGWTFATPTGASNDSAATAVFNTWMHFFLERALADELAAVQFDLFRLDDNQLVRIVFALLTRPQTFVQDTATGQPVLCDNFATAGDDSCSKVTLQALLDAMKHLGSPSGFGNADVATWAWGNLHHLTIHPLFPNTQLDLPRAGELPTGGFPKTGDNFNVNRSDMGWSDLSFSQFADGPAQRFLARAAFGETITVKWQLPGGVIFDSRDPHYRDLLDQYYLAERHFDAPYLIEQIVADGESRWEFH